MVVLFVLIATIGIGYAMPVFILLAMTYEKISFKISVPLAILFYVFIEYLLKSLLHINFYL